MSITPETQQSTEALGLNELLSLIQVEGPEAYGPVIDQRVMADYVFEEVASLTADQLSAEQAEQVLNAMRTVKFAAALAENVQMDAADLFENIEALHRQYQLILVAQKAVAAQEQMDELEKQLNEYKALFRTLTEGTHVLGGADIKVTPSSRLSESKLKTLVDKEAMDSLYERKFSPTLARKLVDKDVLELAKEPGTTSISIKRHASKD